LAGPRQHSDVGVAQRGDSPRFSRGTDYGTCHLTSLEPDTQLCEEWRAFPASPLFCFFGAPKNGALILPRRRYTADAPKHHLEYFAIFAQ